MIKIQLLRVLFGDSLIVTLNEDKENEFILLIDCGFNYQQEILPQLISLGKANKIINKFIITHFDSDHIQNAAEFINENGAFENPKIITIKQIWLNTFRHLQFSKREKIKLNEEETRKIDRYKLVQPSQSQNTNGEISARQASIAGSEILKNKYPWNTDFINNAVCIENGKSIQLQENSHIQLLTPNQDALKALEKAFITFLKKKKIEIADDKILDDAFELFSISESLKDNEEENVGKISYSNKGITVESLLEIKNRSKYKKDSSIPNRSSISFILYNGDKKILFLADCHSEDLIEQLKVQFPEKEHYPIIFDAIKVSHHGSFKNNKPALYDMIDSSKFLFSTNGEHPKHKHPDIETIAHIVVRPLPLGILNRELIFNYELPHLKALNNESLFNHYKYSITVTQETTLI